MEQECMVLHLILSIGINEERQFKTELRNTARVKIRKMEREEALKAGKPVVYSIK
jgi:hypothetical protein